MRALFILYGCPGSGKTRLIDQMGTKHLSLGFDQFRRVFCPEVPCAEDELDGLGSTLRVPPAVESAAVKACFQALEARMSAGSTVFFDTTALRTSSQKELMKRADKHGYTTYIIDVQGDVDLDTILERNRRRGVERVSETRLCEMFALGTTKQFVPGVEVITGSATSITSRIREIETTTTVVAREFVIVGDVHSCATALRVALSEHDAPHRHWVFVGDLFDRGPDPAGVWGMVHELLDQGRATVVTGNHELNLRAVNKHTATQRFIETRDTRDALVSAGIFANEQVTFVNNTVPSALLQLAPAQEAGDAPYQYADVLPWLVTHGGVGESTARYLREGTQRNVCDAECVYGLSLRSTAYIGKTSYAVDKLTLAPRQFHGHRNGAVGSPPVEVVRPNDVVCLESGVSTGGNLSVAVLHSTGTYTLHTYPDGIDPNSEAAQRFRTKPWQQQTKLPLLERMQKSEHIKIKPVEGFPGIVACNFTRKAFAEGAWDDVTVHARGLFMDAERGDIVARGFEKFFHLDEAPGRTDTHWKNPVVTKYPVRVVKKYNGFLALVASVNGKLMVATKAGVTTFAKYAEEQLRATLGTVQVEQLREMLHRTDSTALFEVISHRDPHPIDDGPDRLILLDVLCNTEEGKTNHGLVDGICHRFGLARAEVVELIEAPSEFHDTVARAQQRSDEGVVLVDAAGYRGKVKAGEYTRRKAARASLLRVWRGKSTRLSPQFAVLEDQLREAGLWGSRAFEQFTVTGLNEQPELDIAKLFDELDARHKRN